MMRSAAPATVLLLLVLAVPTARAQTAGDGTRASTPMGYPNPVFNTFSLGFDKLYETYHWNGLLRYTTMSGGPFRLALNDQYLSTIVLSSRKLIRDENSFGIGLRQRFSGRFSGVARETSYVLSDNQNVGINTASSHAVYAGAEYRPLDKIVLEPLAGFRIDNQSGQRDDGPSYMLSLFADDVLPGGYEGSFSGRHRYDRLDPRILETHIDTLRVEKSFEGGTRNAVRAIFARNRRDFYFPADTAVRARYQVTNNIETRTETIIGVGDSLDYTLGGSALLGLQGFIIARNIGRDVRYQTYTAGSAAPRSEIGEFRFDGSAMLAFTAWDRYDGLLQLSYQERTEEHTLERNDSIPSATYATLSEAETRKNNFAHRTSLALRLGGGITRSDSVVLSVSSSLLRYDTPSGQNTDDRDELRDIIAVTWAHRFSPAFALWTVGEVSLNHLVYLNAQRSADNTWNRIYRLAPRLALDPSPSFSAAAAFEVLANYTIYDFDVSAGSVRSFTFRQFSLLDSVGWWLTRRLGVHWYQNMRLYERGELQWQAFSERPLAYFEDHTLIGTVRYRMAEGLLFSAGIRYFSQSRDRYAGAERVPESFLRSAGPVTTVELNFDRRTRIFFNGWYEHQVQTGQRARDIATVTMSCAILI